MDAAYHRDLLRPVFAGRKVVVLTELRLPSSSPTGSLKPVSARLSRRAAYGKGVDSPRTDRLGELFRELLAEEIAALADPRLELATVTDVDVSADLRHAHVYIVGRKGGDDEALLAGLRHAAGHLRSVAGRQVRLKRVPELRFHLDPSIETGERIDRIVAGFSAEADDA